MQAVLNVLTQVDGAAEAPASVSGGHAHAVLRDERGGAFVRAVHRPQHERLSAQALLTWFQAHTCSCKPPPCYVRLSKSLLCAYIRDTKTMRIKHLQEPSFGCVGLLGQHLV